MYKQFTKLALFAVFSASSAFISAQTTNSASSNNPYAPNPRSRSVQAADALSVPKVVFEGAANGPGVEFVSSTSIVKRDETAATTVVRTGAALSEKYTIGTSDILEIHLKGQQLRYRLYTVSEDGTIDFELAGGKVFVASKTAYEIEKELDQRIALIGSTGVSVRVKERASHAVEITGSVSSPGVFQLHRDAVPLYVLNASVLPDQSTKLVRLIRLENGAVTEKTLELQKDSDCLIFPGDRLEYIPDDRTTIVGYYYIAGRASITGKQDLTANLTLSGVVAAVSLQKDAAKRIRIRTRTSEGTLKDLEYDTRSIKSGKVADIRITQGSIVEFID